MKYTLQILIDRDRDNNGTIKKQTIKANNDLEALLYVFNNYDLQNSYYITDEEEEFDTVMDYLKNNKIKEGVELLTNLYFEDLDISDYYDCIVCLKNIDTNTIVIEDDIDIEEWFGED